MNSLKAASLRDAAASAVAAMTAAASANGRFYPVKFQAADLRKPDAQARLDFGVFSLLAEGETQGQPCDECGRGMKAPRRGQRACQECWDSWQGGSREDLFALYRAERAYAEAMLWASTALPSALKQGWEALLAGSPGLGYTHLTAWALALAEREDSMAAVTSREGTSVEAVRWMGAYGEVTEASAVWELCPDRPVSVEVILAGKSGLVKPDFGLLVNQGATCLVAAWNQDVFLPTGGNVWGQWEASQRDGLERASSWGDCSGLSIQEGAYSEGLVSSPQYSSVVYRGEVPSLAATRFAEASGLPLQKALV